MPREYNVKFGQWVTGGGKHYWTGTKEDMLLAKKAGELLPGDEVVIHAREVPFGTVIMNVRDEVAGFIKCDGRGFDTEVLTDLLSLYPDGHVPDWREGAPTGAGQSARVDIINHDVYAVGEFKMDAVCSHTHSVTLTDPGHSHTVTDAGHEHTITDPGHTHTADSATTGLTGSGVTVDSGNADIRMSAHKLSRKYTCDDDPIVDGGVDEYFVTTGPQTMSSNPPADPSVTFKHASSLQSVGNLEPVCYNNEPGYNTSSGGSGYNWWPQDKRYTITTLVPYSDSIVTDAGHAHTVTITDPGHTHTVESATTGLTMAFSTTGITIDTGSTGITVSESAFGSGNVTHGRRFGINFFIKY